MVRKDSMTDFTNDLKHHEKGCCKARRSTDGESDMERYKKIKHYAELALELKCGSN
jgi:hypothetical protein